MAMWSPPGPWALHDAVGDPPPDEGYWAVVDQTDALVGYCCLGDAARPAGVPSVPGRLDIAIGLRPDLTGQGLSEELGRVAVDYALSVNAGRGLRTAVAESNLAGLRAAKTAGFVEVGRHEIGDRGYRLLHLH
ncbi:MAG: [ribosomal protein S18]-alanine N-acetyltransferase [Frankiales bacterium]|nr:[ribosomal protein S18]-alanine N-acetyltransferase [Frankiales bacterium]